MSLCLHQGSESRGRLVHHRFEVVETTFTPATWSSGSIVVDLSALAGQIVQIGFLTNSVEYSACGVYYDNIAFSVMALFPSRVPPSAT